MINLGTNPKKKMYIIKKHVFLKKGFSCKPNLIMGPNGIEF